jgi:periplasmic copper chaperone A
MRALQPLGGTCMRLRKLFGVLLLSASTFGLAAEEVRITDAWARATAPGQPVAGIYMDIVSKQDLKLTGVESPLGKTAELHHMQMDNGTMRMRRVASIDLPAGKKVQLKPGEYHVMLFGLSKGLAAGDALPFRLTLTDGNGVRQTVDAVARVRKVDGSEAHRHH